MDCVVSESCYKGTLLQRMVIFYNFFVKFHGKISGCYMAVIQ